MAIVEDLKELDTLITLEDANKLSKSKKKRLQTLTDKYDMDNATRKQNLELLHAIGYIDAQDS